MIEQPRGEEQAFFCGLHRGENVQNELNEERRSLRGFVKEEAEEASTGFVLYAEVFYFE